MKLKLAVLGSGGIASQHLESLKKIRNYKIKYICDINLKKANILSKQIPESKAIDNFDFILKDKEIDIVDICLPPYMHFSTALKFLKSGKHVICEKPLSTSVREAEELIDYSNKNKVNLYPVFQYRYGKNIKTLKYLINENITGIPIKASSEVHWKRDEKYYNVSWRGTWKGEGGGVILIHAIHSHDILSFVLGDIVSVSANLATLVNDIETEDSASIIMSTKNGALISSSITLGAASNTSRFKFIFKNITAESGNNPYNPGEGDWTYIARDNSKQNELDKLIKDYQKNIFSDQDGFINFFTEIANHLEGKKSEIVEANEGLKSIELVAAIYKAARSEKKVFLPINKNSLIYNNWYPNQN